MIIQIHYVKNSLFNFNYNNIALLWWFHQIYFQYSFSFVAKAMKWSNGRIFLYCLHIYRVYIFSSQFPPPQSFFHYMLTDEGPHLYSQTWPNTIQVAQHIPVCLSKYMQVLPLKWFILPLTYCQSNSQENSRFNPITPAFIMEKPKMIFGPMHDSIYIDGLSYQLLSIQKFRHAVSTEKQ